MKSQAGVLEAEPPAGGLARRLGRLLLRDGIVRHVIVLSGGAALAQLIGILAYPLLSRLYHPADFGVFGLYLAALGFTMPAVSLKYESAIIAAGTARDAAYLTLAAVALVVPVSICAGLVIFLLGQHELFGMDNLPAYAGLALTFTVLPTGAMMALRYWLIRGAAFTAVSQISVYQSLGRVLSQLVFGLCSLGPSGLFFGELVGRCCGVGRILRISWASLRHEVTTWKLGAFTDVLARHYKFPLYSLPSSLIDTLAFNLPVPILAQLHGKEGAGYYTLAFGVLALPTALVGASVADAFHRKIAVLAQDAPQSVASFFYRTTLILLGLGAAPALVVFLFGPHLFALVFGADWRPAGEAASVMVLPALAGLIVSPTSRVLQVFHRLELKLIYDFTSLAATVSVLYLGALQELRLYDAVVWLSGAGLFSFAVYFLLLAHVVRHVRKASFGRGL